MAKKKFTLDEHAYVEQKEIPLWMEDKGARAGVYKVIRVDQNGWREFRFGNGRWDTFFVNTRCLKPVTALPIEELI